MPLRIEAESSFAEILRRISDDGRYPSPWEGKCRRAALVMMAMEDYGSAKEALKACKLAPKGFANAKCRLSIEDFSSLLAMLKGTCAPPITH